MRKKLPLWFRNRLTTVIKHNEYEDDWLTTDVCNEHDKWTPCDLILREYLNNNGGSSRGFLGITRSECKRCYDFIRENKKELIDRNYINREGWNNSGLTLWKNWNF